MEDIKQQIITTALEQFKQYGIKSVSVDDLSRLLGMSKKTFYQYFPGKDELVAAVLESMNGAVRISAEHYMQGKSALECIRMLLDLHQKVGDVHKEPAFAYDLRKYYPQLYKQHVRNVHEGTKAILMRHLQQGIDEGIYRSDLDVETCAVMYSLIQQAFVRNEDEIRSVSPKRLMQFTMESFFRSIVSEEGVRRFEELKNKNIEKQK
ncbi:MAG: TetR/AcrR family transcriptional regulator [Paludibacteraceae bacterium]|nr:TetR/AcrR family transcriptional regulator [Paludibacteraceae bacterium]